MNARELKSRVLPRLLSGRHGPELPRDSGILREDDPRSALKAVGLAGQALRFERPAVPAAFAVEDWPRDERRMVPDALRRPILRLLGGNACTDDTEIALAWEFETRRLRPHPFDLPKMDAFVRKYSQHLGIAAQHWAHRQEPAERRQGYFDAEEIDEQNWTEAPMARRARFLEELRARDPVRGRALLERVWAGESAPDRLRLLAAIETALSPDDRSFLEGIVKDRAIRVKALANRLLARLSGAGAPNPALAACLERIQKAKPGLFKRRNALKLELPANIKAPAVDRWIHDLVADVSFEELASALQTTDAELVPAADKDEHLLFALAMIASREKRLDRLAPTVEALPDAWSRMSHAGFDDLAFVHAGEREQWITTIVRPRAFMPEDSLAALSWLLRRAEGPLPVSIMLEILDSPWWAKQWKDDAQPAAALVQVLCALCQAGLRGTLRHQLDAIVFDRKEEGLLLLEILERLESIG
jgi:uncharacterized protein DUF5691